MKKHLLAATAAVVALVGCSKSSTDSMGTSGSSESGSVAQPLPVPQRSSADTNSITISTNEPSAAPSSSTISPGAYDSSQSTRQPAQPQSEQQPQQPPAPQPQPVPQPEQSTTP